MTDLSGIVMITDGQSVLYQQGFGFADRKTRQPINEHTLFPLASLTKPFTALALPLAAQILPSTSVDPKIDGVFGNEEYAVVQELQGPHIVIGFDALSSQTISEESGTPTTLKFLCRRS